MIPKLHKKGTSFRGAALYLLHDKEASTSERVASTETRNLATKNPEAAWRVMAATALDQARLKSEAGIKTTGRKSKDSVLHLTLSWHPDEAEELTRDEMNAAADGALKALKAEGHQALYVIHDDEPQPHIHIVVNRISPTDGRMLSSSKEKLALSKWAQAYEKERGTIYCEDRVLNNAARARGQYVRGQKDVPRHIFELQASNDNEPWVVKLRQEQQAKDLKVRHKQLAQRSRHAEGWQTLHSEHESGKAELDKKHRRETTIATQSVGEPFIQRHGTLELELYEERVAFAKREQTLLGKGLNLLNSIDWTGLMRKDRRGTAIKEGFGLLAGRVGSRSEALRRAQMRRIIDLEKEEAQAKGVVASEENRKHQVRLQKHRQAFLLKREDVIFRHQMEDSLIATEWLERKKQRESVWEQARSQHAKIAFEKTATPEDERKKAAETFMGRMRKARSEREREKDQDKSTKLPLSSAEDQKKESLSERRRQSKDRDRGDDGVDR